MDHIEHPDEIEVRKHSGQLEELRHSDQLEELSAESDAYRAVPDLAIQPLLEPDEDAAIGVVVAGHICLDITTPLAGPMVTFTPGKSIEVGKALLTAGGPVANTGLALHKLGVTARLMGKVGNDLFGQAIFQMIAAHDSGLAGGMIIAPDEVSSYALIVRSPNGDRTMLHSPGCDDTFSATDIGYELVEQAKLFHFGYPSLMARLYSNEGAELVSIFRRVKELGVTTSLDLSLPDPASPAGRADWQTILAATLPFVDIFLPSIEEVLMMLRRPLYDKLISKARRGNMLDYIEPDVFSELGAMLIGMGAKVVVLKAGHRGLYLRTAAYGNLEEMGHAQPPHLSSWTNRELWAPCFSADIIDTGGAGDTTIAGFLMGVLRGMTPEVALSAACAVGASSVESADTLGGIRSWPRIMGRIADGWPRLKLQDKKLPALDLAAAGWRWDEINETWTGPGDLYRI